MAVTSNSPHLFLEGKLGSARLLLAGISSLDAPVYPVSAAQVSQPGGTQAAIDPQRLGRGLTRVVLSAVVVELVVKHAWEVARSKTAPHTHNIICLCNELPSDVQRLIRSLYDACLPRYSEAIQVLRSKVPAVDVPLASFDEALKWNRCAMRDLKYEMAPSGKAVPYGVFWGSGTIWVPSHDVPLPNYAVELFHWAANFYS